MQAIKLNAKHSTFYNSNLDSLIAQYTCLYGCTASNSSLKNTDITYINMHTLNKVMNNPKYSDNEHNFIDHAILNNVRIASDSAVAIDESTVLNSTMLLKNTSMIVFNSKIDKSYIVKDSAPTEDNKLTPDLIMDSTVDHVITDNILQLLSSSVSAASMKPIITNAEVCLADSNYEYDKAVCLKAKNHTFDVKELKPNYLYNQLISYNENKRVKGSLYSDGLDKIRDEKFNNFTKLTDNMAIIDEVVAHTKDKQKQAESSQEPEL